MADSTPTAVRQASIQPLPEHVVAQIKSSTAIVSLTHVVVDLLKNSLDAGATRIEATIDWARGACSVQDNGLGIPPSEFRDSGGLGKPYWTSKYSTHSDESSFGRNGIFLASLAAMSLLTITSNHRDHRSHNSMTFHHSTVIDRQVPVPSQHEIGYAEHGSRVTVRNLFGNLPVRVKQRAVTIENKAEYDKLQDNLKRNLIALLLGWRNALSLKVRDTDNRVIFQVGGHVEPTERNEERRERSKTLRSALCKLTQAEYISVTDWNNWVPVAANTSVMTIKGAISLDPAPARHVQFISFDIHPLLADTGHNVFYDQINRLFSLSSFGTIEESEVLDNSEKLRRTTNKRFKTEQHTNQQLQARKGVDRYPMFFLKIQLKDDKLAEGSKKGFFDKDANIQTVLEVVNVMLTQWLAAHHFRPRKIRSRQTHTQSRTNRERRSTRSGSVDTSVSAQSKIRGSETTPSLRTASSKRTREPKRSVSAPSDNSADVPRQTPFSDWSRIRSGKADFFNSIWSTKLHTARSSSLQEEYLPSVGEAIPKTGHVPPDTLPENRSHTEDDQQTEGEIFTTPDLIQNHTHPDQTIQWYDKATKRTYLLNSRTGCVVPEATGTPDGERLLPSRTKSIRLQSRPASDSPSQGPFLSRVLETWENPVFKPAQTQIRHVSMEERCSDTHNHPRIDLDQAFRESSVHRNFKLSKEGLRNACVISQVDKKFIFVRMIQDEETDAELLVLIDQHAADERIRVEGLLAELCSPLVDPRHQNYRSSLGHSSRIPFTVLDKPIKFTISSQEYDLFLKYSAYFACWGILYSLIGPGPTIQSGDIPSQTLVIMTLPRVISERCRSDPKLLINFLRSAAWKYTEKTHLPPNLPEVPILCQEKADDTPSWVQALSTCPAGLVDIINSRACRSAIMFNDELSNSECQELVTKLSNCVFPFMCAHGRPSMVPLVDLVTSRNIAGINLGGEGDEGGDYEHEKPFVDAWKAWKT